MTTSSANEKRVLLIDNYDSFTYNVYQFLCAGGANVTVFRNDQVTLEECLALDPTHVVISPGPGGPADAGISRDVIKAFCGKRPILGVCLGEQCMFDVFGGTVTHAGEIVHGKTSPVNHDGIGLFLGVRPRARFTRYHSLAGDKRTLSSDLMVTSWTDSGIVMGVRHKEYALEGVQFHPESVMSEDGDILIQNFLSWTGPTWRENPQAKIVFGTGSGPDAQGKPFEQPKQSILDVIAAKRRQDVAESKAVPGNSYAELLARFESGSVPAVVSFYDRLMDGYKNDGVSVIGEIKRASPSKGDIDPHAVAPVQGMEYARAKVSAISVLTEPTWFKGTLDDMRATRVAIEKEFGRLRPAILRKDFLLEEYQLLEARCAGADAVLLIVALIPDPARLTELLHFTWRLGMEALVEVNNSSEMEVALKVGSKVIGVNNRNLHTFSVDLSTTTGLASMVTSKQDVILAALSGISSRADVTTFTDAGAKCVLVGEAIMRASDKIGFINELKGKQSSQ